jgi:hypothetical protein
MEEQQMKAKLLRWDMHAAALFVPAVWALAAGQAAPQALKPIARWTAVPYQRIDAGQVLRCGVVAFSRHGIAEVRFTVNGAGYRGPASVSVAEMSLNEQTGVHEYWTTVRAEDFIADGVITVEATVRGGDGGIRDKTTDGGGLGLDPLPLVVNPTGSLPQVQAWVSHTASSNSRGAVNDATAPFTTAGEAIDAIRRFRREQGLGDNADGGIVRLVPSDTPYVCSSGKATGRIACPNEWLTITTAGGGDRENTRLTAPASLLPVEKVRVHGVTLLKNASFSLDDPEWCSLWIDRCALIGDGQGANGGHPLLRSTYYKQTFYTDSSITQLAQATTGAALCRGLAITNISDDAFQNVPLVVNCTVDNVQPIGRDGQIDFDIHADAWQHFGGTDVNRRDDNVIVYGLTATNLGYQNLFISGEVEAPPSYARGMAFVNMYMDSNQHPDLRNRHGGWSRWVDHLLWWNCTFARQGICITDADYYYGEEWHPEVGCRITNFSCIGCDFVFFRLNGSEAGIDWSGWDSNHFVLIEEDVFVARGRNFTVGDHMLDASGAPLAGSPLLQRFTPVVPVDARNNLRGSWSEVGAFQRVVPESDDGSGSVGPAYGSGAAAGIAPDEVSSVDSPVAETIGLPGTCGQLSAQSLLLALMCLAGLTRGPSLFTRRYRGGWGC